MISFRLEGTLARELDRIAEQSGLSRSEMLRHLLLASVEQPAAIRYVRQLWAIHTQLQQIAGELEIDEEDAAEFVQKAAESVADSLEELGEEFEDEEDEDD